MSFGRLADWFIHPDYYTNVKTLRKARLLVRACLLTSIFSTTYVVLSLIYGFEKGVYLTGFNVVGYFMLPFLLRTKLSLALLGNLYTLIGAITVLVLTAFSGGMWSAIYPWIIAIPVLTLLVVGKKAAIVWSIFSLACMIVFGVLDLYGVKFPIEYNQAWNSAWYLTILPGLLGIIVVVSFTFESSMQRALDDVEMQKRTIEEQSAALEKLIEDKDNIIRILAHDLRTPLANIGTLGRMLEVHVSDERSKELVDMINKSSANAQILVKHVLEMATLEHSTTGAKLAPTDLRLVLEGVVQSFREASAVKGIRIHTTGLEIETMVVADITYLRSVLENLVSNALKYSPHGANVSVAMAHANEHVQLRIRDHGEGIPVGEEDKLFKKFSRLSVKPTGGESSSGLGLSLVKRYMELMNGRVWFERPGDGGSVFAIELRRSN